ncbi:MAG: diaminopimelate epimerase [Limisphaerales bacterium]
MNGAGNDFVLVDGRSQAVKVTREQVVALCDRHRGIGADGLVVLRPCASGKADWAWEFYNSDGSMGEMCGNAARCFARYVQRQTGGKADLTFQTEAGVITARFEASLVTVNLTAPEGLRLNERVPLSAATPTVHFVNTGVPHAVLFVPDADKAMVREMGPELRRHPHFGPRGANVNFVQVLGPNRIRVRTFERGVEGETLACGTGVTASALITSRIHGFGSPIKVRVQGGDELEVSFKEAKGQFTDVRLTGPAQFVFEGRIET